MEKKIDKQILDKNNVLTQKEQAALKEYVKNNPESVNQLAAISFEQMYGVKKLLTYPKQHLSKEQIAMIQTYACLKGQKIDIDGLYGPQTKNAINIITGRVTKPATEKIAKNEKLKKNTAEKVNIQGIDLTKPMAEYTSEETNILFGSIFGNGQATDVLKGLTNNSVAAMQRVIALAAHEGRFKFHIRNKDPKKPSHTNYSTFQLSAPNIKNKTNEAKKGYAKIAEKAGISKEDAAKAFETMDIRQQNLALWLGYLTTRPNTDGILSDLANENLGDTALATLMSKRIQGGIITIGNEIVNLTKKSTAGEYYGFLQKSGYNPISA